MHRVDPAIVVDRCDEKHSPTMQPDITTRRGQVSIVSRRAALFYFTEFSRICRHTLNEQNAKLATRPLRVLVREEVNAWRPTKTHFDDSNTQRRSFAQIPLSIPPFPSRWRTFLPSRSFIYLHASVSLPLLSQGRRESIRIAVSTGSDNARIRVLEYADSA